MSLHANLPRFFFGAPNFFNTLFLAYLQLPAVPCPLARFARQVVRSSNLVLLVSRSGWA